MAITHTKTATGTDSADPNDIQAGDWNDAHVIGAGTITDTHVAAANKDGAAGTASMRTLGTTATTACAGNDGRLSDARTPTAHSHAQGDVTGLVAALAALTAATPLVRTATLALGSTPAAEFRITVTDAAVTPTSKVTVGWGNTLDTDANGPDMDTVTFAGRPGSGSLVVLVACAQPIAGDVKISYLVGA